MRVARDATSQCFGAYTAVQGALHSRYVILLFLPIERLCVSLSSTGLKSLDINNNPLANNLTY